MSTPVITSKWAGNFDCGLCDRKRLMANEFSKATLATFFKTQNREELKCKQCTSKEEQRKRTVACSKIERKTTHAAHDENEKRKCASCNHLLPKSSFNFNQYKKPEGKSRCRSCVEESVKDDEIKQKMNGDEKIDMARKMVEDLKSSKSATTREIVVAESKLAALEAEKITGLKPVRMGGRGRGRSGGSKRNGRGGSGRGLKGKI